MELQRRSWLWPERCGSVRFVTFEAETAKFGFFSSAIATASWSEIPTKGLSVTPMIPGLLGSAFGARYPDATFGTGAKLGVGIGVGRVARRGRESSL